MTRQSHSTARLRHDRATGAAVRELLAGLAERGIVIVAGRHGFNACAMGPISPALRIGAGELARAAAALAKKRKQSEFLHRIEVHSRDCCSRRIVKLACEVFAEAMQGRAGFSAHRLFNLYFARLRGRRKRALKGTSRP